ncbi:hypothetical protein BU24DRAFT_164791 [Aaosphaeria arxii CBS 175.79]|uniref:Uncharacterized protein n=1 Tax=Aaosphaeria arxii CBS 175.79 TaxID=1450172 RepID=A0A6A5XYQ7_9PLEO|nr:uncharacterized protein BU24DRAFT_164791 [Aaosphaeria arxii CBS 175.79]KAF2018099.1 hypothetical protein BU24DRAFT_164791 [Aaosphaeria arxii CBS 175.79]
MLPRLICTIILIVNYFFKPRNSLMLARWFVPRSKRARALSPAADDQKDNMDQSRFKLPLYTIFGLLSALVEMRDLTKTCLA